ncbi:MAG: 23S rRNA (uracil(1939)-C(5))-methyltransferase RlmD [candidate division NC10 bacterium]|nr:23S rRNA (uracil(1939)-C(5))-methyltransferase RlmD [candidate division NC10 bacterium]
MTRPTSQQEGQGVAVPLMIEKLVFRGDGLARTKEGQVVFVPYAAPGEKIRARIEAGKADYLQGALLEIIEPSPHRVVPPCPYFGTCGGCQWQHLSYPAQLEWKGRILKDLLVRIGKLLSIAQPPPIAFTRQWRYRARAQLKVVVQGERCLIGFYQRDSHRVVDIEACHVLHPSLDQTLTVLRTLRYPSLARLFPDLTEIWLGVGERTGEVLILLCSFKGERRALRYLFHALREKVPGVVGVVHCHGDPRGDPILADWQGRPFYREQVAGMTFRVGAASFFQVSAEARESLLDLVLSFAGLQGEERVLDLYCGVGTFAAPLAKRAAQVIGVEGSSSAARDAIHNVRRNDVSNCRIIQASVEGALFDLAEEGPWDLALLDPPRQGLSPQALKGLLRLAPRKIIYISCDPSTLARDLAGLVQGGYRPLQIQALDLFPQTYHLEAVALLDRASSAP